MALSPEELKSIKEQREATREFAAAAKSLQKVGQMSQENSLRETLGLTKESAIASIQDKLLGNGIKRDIFNFIQDKRKAKALKKSATADGRISEQEYNNAIKRKQQLEKEQATAAAEKKTSDARHAALRATLGDEEANILIEQELLRDKDKIISRDMVLAEQENEAQSLEADTRLKDAAAAKEKADFEAKQIATLSEAANSITESFSLLIEGIEEIVTRPMAAASSDGDLVAGLELVAEQLENSGSLGGGGAVSAAGGGETAAERDAAAAEQENWKSKQLDLLSQIAMSVTKTGGGGSGDGGSGDGGGGMLAKLGAGLGALGKGIGVLLKFAGKGLMIFLKMFAKGIMSFANPLVIGGLAVFTLGMIGLGAALRLAAPAIEAFAPVLIKIADVIGNVLMTAIKEIPAIFESIGSVIEKVGGVIIGIIEAVGGAVAGVVTSIAEGIATVVNAVKGDAKAEAEAQIAVLEAQTLSIQKLSTIDPGTMTATALGIEAIKESLSDLGSPSLLGSLGKMMGGDGPISEILELAKNSGGITAAATAISTFVKNAALFKEGFKMDDSVTENIKKVVDALGSGDKAGLTSIERVIKAINELDTDKISAISAMTIPKIPDMMPSSAESYERVFAALKKTQPSLLENAGNAIFAAAKGMFSPEEPKQNDGGASGKSNPKMGGMPAAANDIKKASEKGPGVKLAGKTYFTQEEINNATYPSGKPVKPSLKMKARRKLEVQNKTQIGNGDPANDSIRAGTASARQSMRASNIAASGGNQSSGQTNVNAPMTNNSRTITTTTNNHSTPHSPSVQSRTAQEFVGFSRGGGNPADF